jgi:hypothetical protein
LRRIALILAERDGVIVDLFNDDVSAREACIDHQLFIERGRRQ